MYRQPTLEIAIIARAFAGSNLVFRRTGILPVIQIDRRDTCPTNGDCFVAWLYGNDTTHTNRRKILANAKAENSRRDAGATKHKSEKDFEKC